MNRSRRPARSTPTTWCLGLAALASVSATMADAVRAAETPVYRCGQTYQQAPCKDGQVITASDPRDASQRQEAQRVAAADRRVAQKLTADRLARDKALRPQTRATGIGVPTPPAPAASSAEQATHAGKGGAKKKKLQHASDTTLYSKPTDNRGNTEARMPAP